jgi:hypothetical protein
MYLRSSGPCGHSSRAAFFAGHPDPKRIIAEFVFDRRGFSPVSPHAAASWREGARLMLIHRQAAGLTPKQ